MALFNIASAARAVGISRNTLYKKIKKGVISATQDRQGNRVIDSGELIRVFGELKEVTQGDSHMVCNHQQQVTFKSDTINVNDDIGIVVVNVLQSQVKNLQTTIDRMQGEIEQNREREGRLLGLLETRLLINQGKTDKKSKKGKRKKDKK